MNAQNIIDHLDRPGASAISLAPDSIIIMTRDGAVHLSKGKRLILSPLDAMYYLETRDNWSLSFNQPTKQEKGRVSQ